MAHESSETLLAECDDPTFQDAATFKAAHLEYLGALAKLGTQIAHVQGLVDIAENGETHAGTLQRIEGLERQAHAVQQHHDKARQHLHAIREAVAQFGICAQEFRAEVDSPTPEPGRGE